MEDKNAVNLLKEKKIKVGGSNDKKIIVIIVLLVLIAALGIFGFFYYETSLKPVVTFDGGNLTTSEFTIYYKTFAPMLEYYGYSADVIPDQIAKKAAADKIILIKAKEAKVTLTDADKAKVDEIFNDKTKVQQFIDDGIDPAKMKELYYNDYVISAYIEKIKKELPEEEVTAYLKKTYGETLDMTEFVTRHILFSTIDNTTGTAKSDADKAVVKEKANAALTRALAGEDFVALAKELSEDTGTKENGGLYSVYLDENTVAEYRNAAKSLTEGSIYSTLVETSYGYHIIKLDKINANGRINSSMDREDIASTKIDEMGSTMNIKVNEELLKALVEKIAGVKTSTETNTETTPTTDTTTNTTTK